MTTHTHTGLTKWEKITMWSIGAFVIGNAANWVADIYRWPDFLQLLFMLIGIAGFVMIFVAAPRIIGGIKTGVIALIAGAVLWLTGMIMKSIPEPSYFAGVEISPFGDPLYIIGWYLIYGGAWAAIVGAIMAVVTYLRRVLRAVEGRNQSEHGVAPYVEDKS